MTRLVKGHIIENAKLSFPFRMILSGSSGSGKTFFAGELLKADLFEDKITNIYYYYPCYLKEAPVNWHETMTVPVIYNVGLPNKSELSELSPKSCVVLDDSFDEAIKSSAIDHLFRVISGKKQICVIIMTQNNFTRGRYGREIRNSCNFSVLFRNCCDTSINENIARMAGVKTAYRSALDDQSGSRYPYVLIDQSQKGQMTPYRVYTNIFDRHITVWSVGGMKAFVIGAQEFLSIFTVEENGREYTAIKNEPSKKSKKDNKSSHSRVTPKKCKRSLNGTKKTNQTEKIRKAKRHSSSSDFTGSDPESCSSLGISDNWCSSESDDSQCRKRLRRLIHEN